MSGYTELSDRWLVHESVDGITAVRVFHDDGGSSDLPEIGDSFDRTDDIYKWLVVIDRSKQKFGGHPSKHLWTVNYSNNPKQGGTGGDGVDMDPGSLPTSGSLSGEFITIDPTKTSNPAVFTWKDTGNKIDQLIPKRIITLSFKIAKRLVYLPLATISKYVGKVNSTIMPVAGTTGVTAGKCLFEGMEYDEYYNNKGARRWKVSFSFVVKVIPLGTTPETYGGWTYALRESDGKYQEVLINEKPMYESANLNALLNLTEAED